MKMKNYLIDVISSLLLASYDLGGVITNSRRDGEEVNKGKKADLYKEMHW